MNNKKFEKINRLKKTKSYKNTLTVCKFEKLAYRMQVREIGLPYAMPGMVTEVSAMFVAITTLRVPCGVESNAFILNVFPKYTHYSIE